MTMATGVDLITARGSNLTSPTVMLASINNNPQIKNRTQIEKKKKPSSESSNRASKQKGQRQKRNGNLGFYP